MSVSTEVWNKSNLMSKIDLKEADSRVKSIQAFLEDAAALSQVDRLTIKIYSWESPQEKSNEDIQVFIKKGDVVLWSGSYILTEIESKISEGDVQTLAETILQADYASRLDTLRCLAKSRCNS